MELDPRRRLILQRLVEAFLERAEPVSSAAVARRLGDLNLSSATIRAAMAELEELGLLRQPHTSAGRVPTELGLRLYLDSLLEPRLRPGDRAGLEALAQVDPTDLPATLGQRLAALTGQVAVVALPKVVGARLREIGLVRYDDHRFLAVFVSPGGLVQQKLVEVEFDIDGPLLSEAQNLLDEHLPRLSIAELRDLILRELAGEHGQLANLRREALDLGGRALAAAGTPRELQLIVEGTSHLVGQPEFGDLERLRRLLQAIEERTALLELLDRVLDGAGVKVMLGSEHQVEALPEVACVGGSWVGEAGEVGAVTLLGPARMNYGRLVPLVGYATGLFDRCLRRS